MWLLCERTWIIRLVFIAAVSVVLENEAFVVLFCFSTDINIQTQSFESYTSCTYLHLKSCSCIFLMKHPVPLQDIFPGARMRSHIWWQLTFFWPPTPNVHLITFWGRVSIMFALLLHPLYPPQITPGRWDEAVAFTLLSRLHICHAAEAHKRALVNMEVNSFYSFIMWSTDPLPLFYI